MLDRIDLEPVFFAPFVSSVMRVEPTWIDYNGHLNMAYYNVLFDRAVDEAFELIGCGTDYVKNRRPSSCSSSTPSACTTSSSSSTRPRDGFQPHRRTCRCTSTCRPRRPRPSRPRSRPASPA